LGVGRDICGSPGPTPCQSRVTYSRHDPQEGLEKTCPVPPQPTGPAALISLSRKSRSCASGHPRRRACSKGPERGVENLSPGLFPTTPVGITRALAWETPAAKHRAGDGEEEKAKQESLRAAIKWDSLTAPRKPTSSGKWGEALLSPGAAPQTEPGHCPVWGEGRGNEKN